MADVASILLDFPPDNVADLSAAAYDKRVHNFLSDIHQISTNKLASVSGQDILDVSHHLLGNSSKHI